MAPLPGAAPRPAGDKAPRIVTAIAGTVFEIACPLCPDGRWPNDDGTGPARYTSGKDAALGMTHHNATAPHDGSPASRRLPSLRPSWLPDRDVWPCAHCGRRVPAGPHECVSETS